MSVIVVKSAPSALSAVMTAVKSVLSGLGRFYASFVAAGAVANALDNHRQPKAADLAVLGLEGVQFKQYY